MKQNNQFDIPIPVILLALVFAFPIGVILAVLRAVSSADAEKKIENIENTVKKAGDTINDAWSMASADFQSNRQKQNAPSAAPGTPAASAVNRNAQAAYRAANAKKPKKQKTSAGLVLSTIACILCFVIGLFGLFGAVSGASSFGQLVGNLLRSAAPFMTLSGISYLASLFFKGKIRDYNLLRALIGTRESVRLSKIAAASGKKVKKICRDLQHLINKGEFGDSAYIDLGAGCFMRYPDAIPEVDEAEVAQAADSAPPAAEKSDTAVNGEEGAASDKARFRAVILDIRRLNDEIHDFAVSEKIYRIEEHTQNIFDYVTAHPEAMPRIRTFMNYYLPTTLKLLESYSRIERMGVAGENMQKSKEKIESILDLLVSGYEQQVDQLFADESIDISSDVSVLETMMQMNGLGGKGDFRTASEPRSTELGGAAAQAVPDSEQA